MSLVFGPLLWAKVFCALSGFAIFLPVKRELVYLRYSYTCIYKCVSSICDCHAILIVLGVLLV